MDANEYQVLVERTKSAAKELYRERIGLSAAGIAGEAAELVDVFRDVVLYGGISAAVDRPKVLKEAGDLCWYIAHLLTTVDLPFAPFVQQASTVPIAGSVSLVAVTFDLMINAGKLTDYLKKVAYHNIEIDKPKMLSRLTLVWCGLQQLLEREHLTVEQVFEDNIAKLRARYPSGFNTSDSLARKDGEQME